MKKTTWESSRIFGREVLTMRDPGRQPCGTMHGRPLIFSYLPQLVTSTGSTGPPTTLKAAYL